MRYTELPKFEVRPEIISAIRFACCSSTLCSSSLQQISLVLDPRKWQTELPGVCASLPVPVSQGLAAPCPVLLRGIAHAQAVPNRPTRSVAAPGMCGTSCVMPTKVCINNPVQANSHRILLFLSSSQCSAEKYRLDQEPGRPYAVERYAFKFAS